MIVQSNFHHFIGIAENKPEEGSVAVNRQKDRIETTNVIRKATEMADNGLFKSNSSFPSNLAIIPWPS